MSIRKRLIVFLFFIATIVTMMGGLLILGAPIFVNAFRDSLAAMESLSYIRELKSHVSRQKTSINRFILLDDNQELLSFEEATALTNRVMQDISNDKNAKAWITDLKSYVSDAHRISSQIITLCKRGDKQRAIDEATSQLFPKFSKLTDSILALENKKSAEAQAKYKTAKALGEKTGTTVFGVFAFALIMGIFVVRSLYASLMKPLEKLRKGTEEFGRGHWDHKIEIPSNNEFGLLANSFNHMAENVKSLQQQAIHMDRMSAVGQLAGGVAHELNNPLTGVLGQTQILLAKTNQADPVFHQLKKIEQAALRCKKIVRGLLDFSRPSQTKFEDVDMSNLLESTIDLCEADLKSAKITLVKKFSSALPKVEGNPSELQQVILNLLGNAIHSMSRGGGTLTLETFAAYKKLVFADRRKGSPPQEVQGDWVQIIVKDTGVGISKEHLNHIFEPFFTTKEIGKGTGLGLSVSVGIARKHGGDISVESQGLNKGAIFFLILPVKGNSGYPPGGLKQIP